MQRRRRRILDEPDAELRAIAARERNQLGRHVMRVNVDHRPHSARVTHGASLAQREQARH